MSCSARSRGGTRRTASVRAVRDSILVRLPPDRLPALAESSPAVSLGLARLVATRAAAGPRLVRGVPPARSIAVVSLDRAADAAGLAERVAERIARLATVRRISPSELESWTDQGAGTVVAELADAEDDAEAVVVSLPRPDEAPEGSSADPRSVALVLRQMDVVVGVATAGGTPDAAVLDLVAHAELPVLLCVVHPRSAQPTSTGRWLDALGRSSEVRGHVHLRSGDDRDLDRLARALTGRSVGVVLGGGGSRGFAHIGVLRALEEAAIPIDRIGGSSMGAIMGAQAAMGWNADEMLRRNERAWSRRRLMELSVPTLSLLRGRRAIDVLEAFYGGRRIEDLWLDYFCTTVDLSAYRLNVVRKGPVVTWVQASSTVPGLWPPLVDDDGHLHVDGGLIDNVPTDVMRASHAGTVIGVDVCHRQSPMRVPPGLPLPGGLALFRARRNGQWYPSIFDVLHRSNLIASLQTHEHAERHANLFIAPPVEEEGFAAFDRVARLADLGYRHAADALEHADLSALRC
jgi:NTE family protein